MKDEGGRGREEGCEGKSREGAEGCVMCGAMGAGDGVRGFWG